MLRHNSSAAALALAALLSCPLAAPAPAQDQLPPGVTRILAHYGIPRNSYSVWVQDISEDEPLLSHGADIARQPASVIKVLTGWLALEGLGPEYRWVTRVYPGGELRDGVLSGPLILQGGGDPHLVVERVWLLQHELRQMGLRHIEGGLVLDDRWLPASDLPVPGFEGDRHRSFSASPYALLMNFQAIRVVVEPDHARGRVSARLDPPLSGLELVNRVRLTGGRCGGFQRGVAVRITGDKDNRVELEGAYSQRCKTYSIPRRALTSPAYAFGLFDALWREGGGELSGGYRLGAAPDDAEPWLEFKSEFASQAVRFMNKHSNNVMARQMLLTLGAETFGTSGNPGQGAPRGIGAIAPQGPGPAQPGPGQRVGSVAQHPDIRRRPGTRSGARGARTPVSGTDCLVADSRTGRDFDPNLQGNVFQRQSAHQDRQPQRSVGDSGHGIDRGRAAPGHRSAAGTHARRQGSGRRSTWRAFDRNQPLLIEFRAVDFRLSQPKGRLK